MILKCFTNTMYANIGFLHLQNGEFKRLHHYGNGLEGHVVFRSLDGSEGSHVDAKDI